MATVTRSMHAVAIDGFGGLEQLQYRELRSPEPQAGEVLVRVRAAGVGIWDSKQRAGVFAGAQTEFPLIVGAELAGVIAQIGQHVESDLHEGDEVYAYIRGRQGAYAEYAAVKAEYVARKPRNLSFAEAAAVPVDAITAHQSLVDHLALRAGETVLIAGAAGGVGSMATQIAARILGAKVVATASARNAGYLRGLGALDVIDYTAGNVVDAVKSNVVPAGVDALLDCVGKDDDAKKMIGAVRDGGRVCELVGEDVPDQRGIRIFHTQSQPSAKRLAELAAFFENGTLRVEIARTFPLAEARAAQALVEERHTRGKIVLTVD